MKFDGFMDSMSGFTQFTIEETTISSKLCFVDDAPRIGSQHTEDSRQANNMSLSFSSYVFASCYIMQIIRCLTRCLTIIRFLKTLQSISIPLSKKEFLHLDFIHGLVPVEAIIAPYESDIRKYKIEIASLQEDIKALERLIKSKDVALVEVERTLHSANERAMIVENLQNQNLELKRQKEICQEENRLLEKANRQKVLEVESLSQTIRELEESILAGGVVANAVRDYQRQVAELNCSTKLMNSRTKVSANRVAAAVANEWKDEGEKLMPVKQWIEERRFLQGEIQRLRDKLTISERTAKTETQLRDKFKLRLKILEEGLKGASNSEPVNGSTFCNGSINKRSSSQPRASVASISSSVLQQPDPVSVVESTRKIVRTNSLNKKFNAREILAKKNLWAPRSKFFDGRGKENSEEKVNSNGHVHVISPEKEEVSKEVKTSGYDDIVPQTNYVSLYYFLVFW
ncbi:microtubule-associated protein 70-5-like [Asparagus officinalis]|uniref:microtubule-associated protein 70-5-like n=1 Tax=Asparagus officinalis TaxID=4686 RepID=UPI00098E4252|nr:microtubule-associated protein 70-5-like [Asparagus officinalis]